MVKVAQPAVGMQLHVNTMQSSSKESEKKQLEQESSLTKEPTEPLMSVVDVLGWQLPEKFPEQTEEEQGVIEQAIANRTPYQVWKDDPTPSNLHAVVNYLNPTIGSVLSSIGGNAPNIRSKARVLAAKSVQSFDPSSGASLQTWVSQNLRQLTRDIRKSNSDIQIPEGIQLDAYAIYKAEQELTDELGREPTVQELSDRSHLSIKRITDVRKKNKKQVAEAGTVQEDGSSGITQSTTDYTGEATDYVYNDSDLNDKKIIEYTTGYGGADVLSSKEIMKRLKLTPVQLTRRKARLSQRIMQIVNDLESL